MHPRYKVLFSLIIFSCFAQLFYYVHYKGLVNYDDHRFNRLDEIVNGSERHDIVYFGTSRTHVHINPCIIDSILGVKSYNLGMDGASLSEIKMLFDLYLKSHKSPQIILFTLDKSCFNDEKKILYPVQYYKYINEEIVYDFLKTNDEKTVAYKYIPFLSFSSYDDYTRFNGIRALLGKKDASNNVYSCKGYLSNGSEVIDGVLSTEVKVSKNVYTSLKVKNILNYFIEESNKRGVSLYFNYAPEYFDNNKDPASINFFENINYYLSLKGQTLNRFDTMSVFRNKVYFKNQGHLNEKGAALYSECLANEFSKLIH